MSTTICFDFGNTRLKAAIFKGKQLEKLELLENDGLASVQKLLDQYQPSKTLLSSVLQKISVIWRTIQRIWRLQGLQL